MWEFMLNAFYWGCKLLVVLIFMCLVEHAKGISWRFIFVDKLGIFASLFFTFILPSIIYYFHKGFSDLSVLFLLVIFFLAEASFAVRINKLKFGSYFPLQVVFGEKLRKK